MQKFVSKKPEGVTTVLILQIGKFTFSGGKAYVSSTFHGSILFINDDIEEIIAFKHRKNLTTPFQAAVWCHHNLLSVCKMSS
ncbi:hypothetical protein HanHA300_Chr02g0049511 [Helianthus annuus]|nr:hypothetical protein HanHA300_Chr02g0049511 [Helianthus annuus]KAJ0618442.1 hypothetical protein HanHA89_Chr02g0053351 [Helianthus annuus]